MSLDVRQHVNLYVATLCAILTLSNAQQSLPLSEDGDHVCTVMESFSERSTVSSTVQYEMTYYTNCGFFMTCSRLRTAYRLAYSYRFVTRYREVRLCCSGYTLNEDSCTPCSSDRWGDNCANECQCENGASCDPQTGVCLCRPGFTGNQCELVCPAGFYGQDCATVCDCPSSCHPENGTCICEPGFMGQSCIDICPIGTFGQDCLGVCPDCSSGGQCDPVTGLCIDSCNCTNGGSCDQQGVCLCPDGFEGRYCETQAQDKDVSLLVETLSSSSSHLLARLSLLHKNADRQSNIIMRQVPSAHLIKKRQIDEVNSTDLVIHDCPENIYFSVNSGITEVMVGWEEPTATSPHKPVTLILESHQPGSNFSVNRSHTVTYVFEDSDGNAEKCEFTITIITADTEAPTVSNCPQNILITREVGVGDETVTWTEPVGSDDGGGEVTVLQSHVPGSMFPAGDTLVNYTFVDEAGNSNSCIFVISVDEEDTQPPVVTSCPDDIIVGVDGGRQSAVVSWNPPTATDLSGAVFQSHQFNPNTSFHLGDTEVEYIFVDTSGNEASCKFTVSVMQVDTADPVVVNCTSTIHRTVELGTPDLEVTWVEPTAFDAFDPELDVQKSHSPPASFTVGTHTVVYSFTDDAGNEAVCSFNIIILAEDTLPPVIENCPSNISDTTELGTSSKVISWGSPSVTDASDTIIQDQSHFQGEAFPLGTTQVTITYTDGSGNSAMCQFFVTLTTDDSTAPFVENCPTLIVEQVQLGEGGTEVYWDPVTVTDFSQTITLFQSYEPGDFFPVGISDVIILFGDTSGNQAGCYFKVEIIEVDTSPPIISGCPTAAINKTVDLMVTSAIVSWMEPTATDLSGVVTRNRTAIPGSSFSLGITKVTYTFVDDVGNSATCSFQVSVVQVDTQPPQIMGCPEDIIEIVEIGTTEKEVTWTEPTATDLSGVQLITQTHFPPTSFPLGPTIVTYTFRDSAGISNQCSFDITIIAVDTMKPVINGCPEDIFREIEAGMVGVFVYWTEPRATDNSGMTPFLIERTSAPGDNFPPGNTTVRYKFLDFSSNVAVCSFSVIVSVEDTTPPQIIFCPPNINAPPIELGTEGTTVSWPNEPFAYDFSGDPVELVFQTHQSNDFFYPGGTAVTYRFRDPSGNEAACSFLVIVGQVDTTPPEINDCPLQVTEVVELGTAFLPVNWTVPYAIDISNNVTLVSYTHTPGDLFFIGKTDVTYLFKDISGNEADCTFQVIVTTMDTTPPIIFNCPSDITITIPYLSTSGEVTWTEPTAMDLSGVAVLFNRSAEPGSVFNVGASSVSYIFRDQSNNRAYCNFLVTVITGAPDQIVISNCPGNIEVTTEPNEDVRVVWSEPTASIAGTPAILQGQSHTSPAVFSPGETTVVYIFRDDAGNTATCSFTVTVLEVDPLRCLEINITAEAPPEQSFVAVNWTTAAITNYTEDQYVIVTNYSSGDVFPIGSTDVDYILFDIDSRSVECVFTVIVLDVTPPIISDCPNDVSIGLPDGVISLAVTWEEPTASDNSRNVTERKSNKPGDNFKIGTQKVLYEFSDLSGNTATCSFDIILTGKGVDNSSPENGLFQNDFVITILASSGIILLAVIIVAICLASMCCCRGKSNDITSSEEDVDIDDNYFNEAYHVDEQAYRYVNNGFTRTEMYAEGKYDEPPTMSQTLKYSRVKANGHSLPPGGHYSQTLPARPIQDPLDEGTRTIKHSYNGPIPGKNGNGVKPKNNYPPLEVELQQPAPSRMVQRQTFLPIPEEVDMGDYLEIKGTAL
ncbi:Hyalin [Holothuria leucospilota]|uniref:Hyalin n=1 Tax=Holothuria leucospilota TaxID=206669 RepID=A0A9Q1C018_HOLLE|nr:Hyalin [Holothuria leucospilota]